MTNDTDQNLGSDKSQITQMVLECKGQGNFLPYIDYEFIDQWIHAAKDVDELLVVLSDVLPSFFGEGGSKKQLSGVHKLVMACLKDRAMRTDS